MNAEREVMRGFDRMLLAARAGERYTVLTVGVRAGLLWICCGKHQGTAACKTCGRERPK